MAVAILHYHLQRGGVTRVIEGQSAALRDAGVPHLVLAGSPYEGPTDLPVAVIPELNYHSDSGGVSAIELEEALRRTLGEHLDSDDILWHIHNPTLGKNILMPDLIRSLSNSGDNLLLHFHDFAEDNRPRNYELLSQHQELYPVSPRIGYGFINSRDLQFLRQAGLPAENSFLLPNPVLAPPTPVSAVPHPGPPLVLYPVRGIRRKNLGEMCLLASLSPSGTRFASTLAPENPQWRPIHDRWAVFAADENLPVSLGAVGHLAPHPEVEETFENWLAHATHLLTTSVAEGFGMAFLEPNAHGKPLIGRNLPEITQDFADRSQALGNLYERILVPASWINPEKLLSEFQKRLADSYRSYRTTCSEETLRRGKVSLLIDDFYDFGNLPELIQEEVIQRSQQSPGLILVEREGKRLPLKNWLALALSNRSSPAGPSILDRYSLSTYQNNLLATYHQLQQGPSHDPAWLSPASVLNQFLAPERFHFLRS